MKYFLENNFQSGQTMNRLPVLSVLAISTLLFSVWVGSAFAENSQPEASLESLPIVVSGVVPDEATKAKLIGRLRDLYGNRVVDQLAIGSVIAPPNWAGNVHKILNEQLRHIKKGQLQIDGNVVQVRGQIANEALRQQFVSQLATQLTSNYSIKDGLSIQTSDQISLDRTLGNRIVEFDSGSANLRDSSKPILNELAASIVKLGGKTVEIVGHTDNEGNPNNNLILSRARAEAVKQYLLGLGIASDQLTTIGMGASQPLTSNEEAEGRKRNRRIEFRIAN